MRLTPAQRALREAARTLAKQGDDEQGDGARALAVPEDDATAVVQPVRAGARRASRLLELEELYVGRPALGAELAYRDGNGDVVADVNVLHTEKAAKIDAVLAGEGGEHADERWVVIEDEEPLFYIERYRAADHPSYGVFTPDGEHLATYLAEGGGLHHDLVVREAASAPVAAIRAHRHRHVITEADGRQIGWCWRAFSAFTNDDDDEVWGIRIEQPPDLLDRRALVAAPLVCHLTAFPKRHFDSGGELALVLVATVPPVGLAVAGIERAVDGLYWLRRRLD